MATRAIVHLDMDSFFVAVERRQDARLVGRPVVVGGSPRGRGVVASASYEARAYGIHAAMPMAEALRRCPELIICHGHFTEYVKWSRRVRRLLEQVIPVVEQASIDEFYGDLTGTRKLLGDPAPYLQGVLAQIRKETGLPCSAALATNKLVAKVAIRWAKPNGFWEVPPGAEARQFAPLPVSALPGIGPVTASRLERQGIQTLGDLAAMPATHLEVLFGRHGPGLATRARGESDTPVEGSAADAKSVGHEVTFPRDLADPERLKALLWELAAKVGYKLRQDQCVARTLTLKLRKGDFSTLTRSRTLPAGTNRDYALARVAEDLFNQVHRAGQPVRLLGIRASGLLTWCEQQWLFDAQAQAAEQEFYTTLDAIRDRFGFGAITNGKAMQAPGKRLDPAAARPGDDESLFALGSRQAVARMMEQQPEVAPRA